MKDVEEGSESIEKRSEELRKKITTIQRCDLKSEHPLGKDYEGILFATQQLLLIFVVNFMNSHLSGVLVRLICACYFPNTWRDNAVPQHYISSSILLCRSIRLGNTD